MRTLECAWLSSLPLSAGGHLNPAVSLGFFIAGRVSFIRAFLYTICQVLGAAVGAALIRAVSFFPDCMFTLYPDYPVPRESGSPIA